MIFISYDSTIKKVDIIKIVILTSAIGIVIYFIFLKIPVLPPRLNIPLSLFISLITSLIIEFGINKNNKLFDSTTVGTILGKIKDGDFDYIDQFSKKYEKWIKKKHRILCLDETNLCDDLKLLLLVYESCSVLDFFSFNEKDSKLLFKKIKKRKRNIFHEFGINFDIVETIFFINITHFKYYYWLERKYDKYLCPNNIPRELKLLYKFAIYKINEIDDPYVLKFCTVTKKLKKLISYNSNKVINKDFKVLLIFSDYIKLFLEIIKKNEYYILKQSILLQMANCLIFSNFWKYSDKNTESKLIKLLSKYNFNSVEDVKSYLINYNLNNDLFVILFSPLRNNAPLVFEQFKDRLNIIKQSYPDIINISIINSFANALETGIPKKFLETFNTIHSYFDFKASSILLYKNSYIIAKLLVKHLKEGLSVDLIKEMIKIADKEKDFSTKRSAAINAFIFSCLEGNKKLFIYVVRRYIFITPIINRLFAKKIIKAVKMKQINFSWYVLPFWYPVEIMMNIRIIPFLNKEWIRRAIT